MGDYREYNSKKTCLALWIINLGVAVLVTLILLLRARLQSLWLLPCIFIAQGLIWWYRWFAYDKKK